MSHSVNKNLGIKQMQSFQPQTIVATVIRGLIRFIWHSSRLLLYCYVVILKFCVGCRKC